MNNLFNEYRKFSVCLIKLLVDIAGLISYIVVMEILAQWCKTGTCFIKLLPLYFNEFLLISPEKKHNMERMF